MIRRAQVVDALALVAFVQGLHRFQLDNDAFFHNQIGKQLSHDDAR